MKPSRTLPISPRFSSLMESAARAIEQGTPDLADQLYGQAAEIHPEVFIGLASSFRKEGNIPESMKWSLLALEHAKKPKTRAACLKNVAVLMISIGEYEKAEACLLEGMKLDKREPELLANYSLILKAKNQIPQAMAVINRVIQNDPINHHAIFARSMMKLVSGDLLGGFGEYESRFKNPTGKVERLATDKPEWKGEDIRGKRLMVYCEQGSGDVIMMARYDIWLRTRGAIPLLRCQRGLKPLLVQTAFEVVAEEGETLPAFDVCVPMMSLPLLHGTHLGNIIPAPYLDAHDAWELEGRFKVGLAWAGSVDHTHDATRSTDLSMWKEVLAVPGVSFFSLQVGIRSMDLIGTDVPIIDLAPRIKNYADTANAIAGLDLVICIDTSVAHLAGAMGKEAWVLLPFACDWRWLLDRTDSPWYPSILLCRQRAPKEWEPLIGSVAGMLRARMQQGSLEVEPGTCHPEAVPL